MWVQYLFCMVAIHLQNWCMIDLLTDANCSFHSKHCSSNMISHFTHAGHTSSMTRLNLVWLFKNYPKLMKWVTNWLRFSTFTFQDAEITTCKVMIQQWLQSTWFMITICSGILIVMQVFDTKLWRKKHWIIKNVWV